MSTARDKFKVGGGPSSVSGHNSIKRQMIPQYPVSPRSSEKKQIHLVPHHLKQSPLHFEQAYVRLERSASSLASARDDNVQTVAKVCTNAN